MAGRFQTVGFFVTVVLLGLMNALSHAQDASPQPQPSASSSSPSPRPDFFQGNDQKRPLEDRPFFKKGGGDFAQARKILQDLSPEQREKFMENFQRWQNMTPEERNALRDREIVRRQKILQEIDKSIAESGLQLDKDTREMYILRYSQERRKIEEKLQKEIEERRRPMLEDMNNRLKEEFKAMPAKTASPSPAPSESSASPSSEATSSPTK